MEPRLSSSQKWTSVPSEYLKQIQEVFAESFGKKAGKAEFLAEGRIYPKELLLRVGLSQPDQLKQANFEVSLEYERNKDNMVKMIHLAIDVAASMVDEYFNQGGDDEDFPRIWTPFEAQGRTVHIQYSVANSELEAEADRLLGIHADSLVEGEDVEELEAEKKGLKKMLGLEPDEGEEES